MSTMRCYILPGGYFDDQFVYFVVSTVIAGAFMVTGLSLSAVIEQKVTQTVRGCAAEAPSLKLQPVFPVVNAWPSAWQPHVSGVPVSCEDALPLFTLLFLKSYSSGPNGQPHHTRFCHCE